MNIKENLTCKHCYQVYSEPITLTCGHSLCKQHIQDLQSVDHKNTFLCPFCNEQYSNQNFKVNEALQYLLDMEAHKFTIDSKYEQVFTDFKTEIINLESILNEPENVIYEEIHELKRQVDLDREIIKSRIDALADDIILQLELYEKQFKEEYKTFVNMKHFVSLVETSKQKLKEYEKCLSLFSTKAEEKDKQSKESKTAINNLQSKIKELKDELFLNFTIAYIPMTKNENEFGKLRIKSKTDVLGNVYMEFKRKNASLAALPNGDLAIGCEKKIEILDTNDGKVKQTLIGHSHWINDLIAVDENRLISASDDKTIKIWNISKGSVDKTLFDHTNSVLALKMISNAHLASGSADTTIKIWNIDDGALIKTLTGQFSFIWAIELLPNGDLVTATQDTRIKIWNVNNGTIKRALKGHSNGVKALVLFENGDLVSGSYDHTIKIWNTRDGTVKRTLKGHTNSVLSLKLLKNGDLVSGSNDGTIKIWDMETGTVKKEIEVNSTVKCFEVLSNGDLVSASHDSTILWN